MSLFDTSIIAYSTKDCYILSILTKRAKLPKIKTLEMMPQMNRVSPKVLCSLSGIQF